MHLIVPAVGLEPTLLSEPVPKTGASAVPPRGDNTAQTVRLFGQPLFPKG